MKMVYNNSIMLKILCIIALVALAKGNLQRIHLTKNPNHFITMGNVRAERNSMMTKHNVQVNDNSTYCVVELDNYISHAFTGVIQIGTPPQNVTALFSTGTGSLFVTKCSSNCNGLYNPSSSSSGYGTSYNEYYDAQIDGASGYNTNHGSFAEEIVNVAGMRIIDFPFVTLLNQEFYSVGAVFGLGSLVQYDESEEYTTSRGFYGPIYTMYQQGFIQNLTYSLYWHTNGGQVIFGGADPSLYLGELSYNKMGTNKWGNIYATPNSVTVDNEDVNLNNQLAYFDSGYNLIGCPINAFVKINQKLNGLIDDEGNYFVDCSKIDTFPNIYFDFNDILYTLKPQSYILKVNGTNAITPCMSAFSYVNLEAWTLGLPFMTTVYTEFDLTNKQVGIAPLA